ncbi:hypothetical protein ID866_1751 [Astraeus odoratus]|nr:hypothetical protein ID866_1751 [Astraeus odoratus]
MQQSLDVGDESVAHRYIKLFGITDAASKIFATPGNGITEAVGGFPATAYHSIDPIHLLRVDPDTATFTILINYLAKRHRLCEVHELLDRMVDVGVKPDSGIIAALIRAYCLNHRDDLAMGLLAAMLYPDDAARMLHHLIGVKFVPEQTIDVKGIQLTVHVFNAILGRAVELRGLSGARFIFRTMHTRGIKPNAATVEIFLDYLDRTESVNPLQLIRILRSMSTATHGPTLRHLHVILRNILRQGKYLVHRSGWDAIASKFSPTRESIPDLTPDFIMVGSNNFEPGNGLTSSWRSRYDSWLRPIVLSLSRRAINSDRATIAMQLRHASMLDPSLDTARDVFRHMIDQGIHPNRYHYTALMDGYAKGGNMVGAERTMRAAREAGFGPEVVMYTVLIDGYGRQGKPELAMQAFCRMVSAGIAPDVAAIDALARAYFIVGGYNVARRVLLQLWSQVKPFPPELQGATLKHLAASFRSHSADGMSRKQFLTRCQQKLLGRKVRCFQQEWRQLELLQGIHSGRLNRCRAWLLKYSQDSAVDHHT